MPHLVPDFSSGLRHGKAVADLSTAQKLLTLSEGAQMVPTIFECMNSVDLIGTPPFSFCVLRKFIQRGTVAKNG